MYIYFVRRLEKADILYNTDFPLDQESLTQFLFSLLNVGNKPPFQSISCRIVTLYRTNGNHEQSLFIYLCSFPIYVERSYVLKGSYEKSVIVIVISYCRPVLFQNRKHIFNSTLVLTNMYYIENAIGNCPQDCCKRKEYTGIDGFHHIGKVLTVYEDVPLKFCVVRRRFYPE